LFFPPFRPIVGFAISDQNQLEKFRAGKLFLKFVSRGNFCQKH
jgi:hypothetical protein